MSKKAQNDFKSILVKWLKHMENDPAWPPLPPQHMEFSICFMVFFIESFPYLLHLFDCVSKMLRIANWKLLPLHNKISSRRTFCFSFWLYTQLEKMQQGFFLRDSSVQVQDLLTGWKMTTNLSGNYLIKKIILQENFTFNEQ